MEIRILSEVCLINPSHNVVFSSDDECSFIPMDCVDDEFGLVIRQHIRKVAEVQKGYTPFQEGDILFAKITPCMENGKCAIARGLMNGIGFGSTEFHVIRSSHDVVPEWILYYLRQEHIRKQAEHRMIGSAGQKRVPKWVICHAPRHNSFWIVGRPGCVTGFRSAQGAVMFALV